MDFQTFGPSSSHDDDDASDEDFGHQYDDYEDLFSNETESVATDLSNDQNLGMYLEVDPTLQKEVAQLIILRRHLDSLQQTQDDKQFAVVKTREELEACRVRLKALEAEKAEVADELSNAKAEKRVAVCDRLGAQLHKLDVEIDTEVALEEDIKLDLGRHEVALSKLEIEQRHFTELAAQVGDKEEKIATHKTKMAEYRMKKRKQVERQVERKWKQAEQTLDDMKEQRKVNGEIARQKALSNQKIATKFLQQSLGNVKQVQGRAAEAEKKMMERKMDAIVELKDDITSNQENLRALQARDRAFQRKRDEAEQLEREQVIMEGGNPAQVIRLKKQQAKLEQETQDFVDQQRKNKVKIVSNILNEEKYMRRLRKAQPYLFPDKRAAAAKIVKPIERAPIDEQFRLDDHDRPVFVKLDKFMSHTSVNKDAEGRYRESPSPTSSVAGNEPHEASFSAECADDGGAPAPIHHVASHLRVEDDDVSLARPEFEGLWAEQHKPYKIPVEEKEPKPIGGTKMEKDILQKTLQRHHDGMIVKQVAAGREFHGQPFYSKPDVIHFTDLEVGKVYKKKVVITNVSYSINFCKMTGLSEHLKDFINIQFRPPGQMSAGMSCEMFVTFKPMINQDLEGEVFFMAQTAPFTIPLKCSTKKCKLSVDMESIDFGTQVVGETIRRSITLVNSGGLGTQFEFLKVPDKAMTAYTLETSLGRLTSAGETATPAVMTPHEQRGAAARTTTESGAGVRVTAPTTATRSRRRTTARDSLLPAGDDSSLRLSDMPEVVEEESGQFTDGGGSEFGNIQDFGDDMTFSAPPTGYGGGAAISEEMHVGEVMSGEIGPHSSLRLDIVFSPCIPGDINALFRITFADPGSDQIDIKACAVAIDVPVWLERTEVDLKICMYDRLYQDQILVHNRASTALRLTFEVPRELRNHMELLPKTGYIQAKSTFTAQLKFLPRSTLAADAPTLYDGEVGVLESPMVIRVADQTRPVPFVVNAVVTESDLDFDRSHVDFGHCSVYEAVTATVRVTNRSILPQQFGFVHVPDYVEVQPNDGFGTILPRETIAVDVIVKAKQARAYNFTLTLRSGINRDFPLHCKAVGVLPPLELSHQVIHCAATALDDVTTANIYVVNSHTSSNEFTHPVPRIGKGEIAPVGPTSFEFVPPPGAPLSIYPAVGTVEPGQKFHVTIEFAPKLNDADVRKEALTIITTRREEKNKREEERKIADELAAREAEEKLKAGGKKAAKGASAKGAAKGAAEVKSNKGSARSSTSQLVEQPLPTLDEIDPSWTEYKAARAALARNFHGTFSSVIVPCFVASGRCSATPLQYEAANTLYLELHCPTIKPPVVVISNDGDSLTDFGQISIGLNATRPISIQNISDDEVELRVSTLDTTGPFQMMNAMRSLHPGETHTIIVQFTPLSGKVYYEVMKLYSGNSALDISLTGKGVTPVVKLIPEQPTIDCGHVLSGEEAVSHFTLVNESSLAIEFGVRMDSGSLLKHSLLQQLPEFIRRNDQPNHTLVGTQNHNGSAVFDCWPCTGNIGSGESREISVAFRPDHPSDHFSDGVRIVLFDTDVAHVVQLTGKAVDHMMYVTGQDPLDVGVETLTTDGVHTSPDADYAMDTRNLMLSFRSRLSDGEFKPSERTLEIGCVKSLKFIAKKSVEWSADNLIDAQAKGFGIEPLKCVVDVETTKPLVVTWNPPENHDPYVPVNTSFLLTIKGDVTQMYNVMLSGVVSFV